MGAWLVSEVGGVEVKDGVVAELDQLPSSQRGWMIGMLVAIWRPWLPEGTRRRHSLLPPVALQHRQETGG